MYTSSTQATPSNHAFDSVKGELCLIICSLNDTMSIHVFLICAPQTVTCTELASIVTTEDNSLLVWGSRPIIRSPLMKLLSQHGPRSSTTLTKTESGSGNLRERSSSLRREESDVFEEELPRVNSALLSPTSFDLGASLQSVSSGHLASNEASPERKPSSSEASTNKTSPKDPSNESLNQSNPKFVVGQVSGSKEHLRRYSSLNLSDTPHITYPCSSSKDYIEKMNGFLQDISRCADLERNRSLSSPVARHREPIGSANQVKEPSVTTATSGQQLGAKVLSNKRINSTDLVTMDGVIMRPTSIDLIGRSGLLSTLSVQGMTNAKLEGVSCFGCNVLILIEAQVLLDEGESEGVQQRVPFVSKPSKQPKLVLGRKLTEKSIPRR